MLQKKSVLIVLLAAGLLLLLWPRSSGSGTAGKNEDVSTTEEKRLCAVLSKIDGVGEVYALLSEEPNRRGEYTGAVVVCSGARSSDIRLRVILNSQRQRTVVFCARTNFHSVCYFFLYHYGN